MNTQPLRIVVIDDSITTCKIIETCLRRDGYKVTSFQDPLVAVRAFFATPAPELPNLLIVDIGLSTIDGYALIMQVRHHPLGKQIPSVLLSEHDGVLLHLKAKLAGASAVLIKPLHVQQLVAVVEQLTGQKSKEKKL